MGTDDKDDNKEILDVLHAIAGLIRWIGFPFLGGVTLLVLSLINDHYDQVELRKDDNWMKPRVQRLWLRDHPEFQTDEAPAPISK